MTITKTSSFGQVPKGARAWWFTVRRPAEHCLLVVPTEEDVLDLVDDLQALSKLPNDILTQAVPSVVGYAVDDIPARQVALYQWLKKDADALVVSIEGLSTATDSADQLIKRTFRLIPGLTISRTKFEDVLANGGYARNDYTEQVGEYSIRGDVIDLWPAGEPAPIRIGWNFDTVETLRVIDLHTQRSEEFQRAVVVCPVTAGTECTLVSCLPPDAAAVLFDVSESPFPADRPVINVSAGVAGDDEGFVNPPVFAGHVSALRDQLKKWHEDDWKTVIFCHNRGEKERLEDLLIDPVASLKGQRTPWLPPLIIGELEHGFVHPIQRLAVLTNSEIFGRYRKRVRLPKFEGGGSLTSYLDIKPNDFLVHERYGIGRYSGLKTLRVDKVTSEYMTIEYKGGDKVYVPIFELQQVQKYLGAEGKRPQLSSLDTAAWERVKAKVKEDIAKLAADLLRKAAKRTVRPGFAFPAPTRLEQEFAASFIYTLTPDQQKTLSEVENDMMTSKSMDRLICGDVGFGKTEIAMRAALKAALAGKQVAVLCPTTILAEQHARNFAERLADYPVTVRLLSRFQEKKEQKEILVQVAKGGVDIIIGTHRLLSSDVHFKDVGLLIIDEEHRFGVKQKNKLFAMRETVDVLSLTATPIPRTLASALGGIKNLSIIETPPQGRLPISTHVGAFDEDIMAKAIQEEIDRGGQVFYVHNRVKTLLARKEWLEKLLPTVRIVMAHGQMNEHQLEKAMYDFVHRKADLLLATTIIESGLDIPSVNTLIIEEAEELGLAQLYQLRGRVGRSRARAYCYLFYTKSSMTADAKKRLEALKEFTSLGSGLRLAMRDMEIRGAGNILGPQQHGNMAAVGVETYSRLLAEEVQKMQGGDVVDKAGGPVMELNVSAYLPDDYVPSEAERVSTYKRILTSSADELAKVKEELIDRCGPLPEPARLLFATAEIRLRVQAQGISEIHQEEGAIAIYFRPKFKLSDAAFNTLVSQKDSVLTLIPGEITGVRVYFQEAEEPLDVVDRFLSLVFH
jgi:transcription-repair coupling factor (superfamily II helicase)